MALSAAARRLLVLLLGAAAGLALSAPAQSPKSLYKDGLEALEEGRLDEAVERLRQAIEGRPEEDERLGLFSSEPYVPHYYLGVALRRMGACRQALEAWAESERQGAIKGLVEYAQLLRGRESCEQERRLEAATQSLEGAIAAAAAAAAAASESRALPEAARVWDELGLAERERLALRDLETARERLAGAASSSPEALDAARRLAGDAKRVLEELRSEARAALETRRNEQLARLGSQVEEVGQLLRSVAYLEPYPPVVRERRQAVLDLLEAAPDDPAASLEAIARHLQALEEAAGALRSAAAPPPAELRRAAEAFLAGDYQAVVDGLADVRYRSSRGMSRLRLLQAAALFGLSVSAEEPQPLLEEARAAVLAWREADPSLTPSERVFSPGFVRFCRSVVEETDADDPDGG